MAAFSLRGCVRTPCTFEERYVNPPCNVIIIKQS